MRIDHVLVTSDLNQTFLSVWPRVYESWKRILPEAKVTLVLISHELPESLPYHDHVILFTPLDQIHTAFQAQCIRLLYPGRLTGNVLISDIDIIPARTDYFVNQIKDLDDNLFVSYRNAYFKQEMCAICYNVANSETWKEIFGEITSDDQTGKILQQWYTNGYDGRKNCPGWYTDQKTLYRSLQQWKDKRKRWVVIKDEDSGFCRLDKRQRQYIAKFSESLQDELKSGKYVDFHVIRPYYMPKIARLVDRIISMIHQSGK